MSAIEHIAPVVDPIGQANDKIARQSTTKSPRVQNMGPLSRSGIRPKYVWTSAFVLLVLIHRATLFFIFRTDLHDFLSANSDWLTWQFLTPNALRDHFWLSLLYLQQTPPVPNVILGMADIAFATPLGRHYFCLALQVVITLSSGVLMINILHRLTRLFFLPSVLVLIWALGNDTLTMEYNSHGQTFYENLAMLLLLAITSIFIKWREAPRYALTCLLGLTVSILALTRASFSFFFLLPLVALIFSRPKHTARHVLLYLTCALTLHGAWCLKNALIYGHPSLATSSWKGLNLAAGLQRAGQGPAFVESIVTHADRYPAWFVRMVRTEGLVLWHPAPKLLEYVPAEVLERNNRIQDILAGTNRPENWVSILELSELYAKAFRYLAFEDPQLVYDKTLKSYQLMWEPIHTYSSLLVDFFHTLPTNQMQFPQPDSFSTLLDRYRVLYMDGRSNELFVAEGTYPSLTSRQVRGATVPFLPGLIGFLNIFVFHASLLLVPLLFFWRNSDRESLGALVFIAGCILYLAVVSSIAEFGENMRFRLAVEPLIWINSIVFLVYLVRASWSGLGDRLKPSDATVHHSPICL